MNAARPGWYAHHIYPITLPVCALAKAAWERWIPCRLLCCALDCAAARLASAVAALREWWASREAGYAAPRVTVHPLVPIASVQSLPVETYVRCAAAVVLHAEAAEVGPTSKGGEASKRVLTIADASGKSTELTIWGRREDALGGDVVGSIISLNKAQTRAYRGTPTLSAFNDDVDYAPTHGEAHALHQLWVQTPPEVTPLLPSLSYTSIASLAPLVPHVDVGAPL